MPKITRIIDSENARPPFRVTHRKARKKKSASIRVKCGCCKEAVEIYPQKEPDENPSRNLIEINGVFGTMDQWRQVLCPLLGLEIPRPYGLNESQLRRISPSFLKIR